MDSSRRTFKVGEKVFAKVRGYPPWPAKVVRQDKSSSKSKYKVLFYGTYNSSELKAEQVFPFEEHKEKMASGKARKGRGFMKALEEAEDDDSTASRTYQKPTRMKEEPLEESDWESTDARQDPKEGTPFPSPQEPKTETPDSVEEVTEPESSLVRPTANSSSASPQEIAASPVLERDLAQICRNLSPTLVLHACWTPTLVLEQHTGDKNLSLKVVDEVKVLMKPTEVSRRTISAAATPAVATVINSVEERDNPASLPYLGSFEVSRAEDLDESDVVKLTAGSEVDVANKKESHIVETSRNEKEVLENSGTETDMEITQRDAGLSNATSDHDVDVMTRSRSSEESNAMDSGNENVGKKSRTVRRKKKILPQNRKRSSRPTKRDNTERTKRQCTLNVSSYNDGLSAVTDEENNEESEYLEEGASKDSSTDLTTSSVEPSAKKKKLPTKELNPNSQSSNASEEKNRTKSTEKSPSVSQRKSASQNRIVSDTDSESDFPLDEEARIAPPTCVDRKRFLHEENKMVKIEGDIRRVLNVRNPQCSKAIEYLEDFSALKLEALMVKKHPIIIDTIRKLRRYVGPHPSVLESNHLKDLFERQSKIIRKKADTILEKQIKPLFARPPAGVTFWDFFYDSLEKFRTATKTLSENQVAFLTLENQGKIA